MTRKNESLTRFNRVTEPILIECEGSGAPAHLYASQISTGAPIGICSMCGTTLATNAGIAPLHTRDDILARFERGDFDA